MVATFLSKLIDRSSARPAMELEVATLLLFVNVAPVMVKAFRWSCNNLDQECTLKLDESVLIAMEKEPSSTKRKCAKSAKERKLDAKLVSTKSI